jgi:DNA-binding transcriptional LysR family regulator
MESDNAMRAFVSVVEEKGFSAAARLLGVPTSTISRQMSRLEQRLDARLLNRTTRSLTPTDIGWRYFEHCKRIVGDIAEAEDEIRELQSTPRGRVRLSMMPTIPMIQNMLSAFMNEYPEIELEVLTEMRYVDLAAEGIDVALRTGQLKDSSLVARQLLSADLAAFASAEYLERNGTPQTTADLSDHQCLAHAGAGDGGQSRWPTKTGKPVAIKGRLTTSDLGLIANGVVNGLGIGLVLRRFVEADIKAGRVIQVLEDELGATMTASLVYPSSRFLSARVRAFVDFALAYAKEHDPNSPVDNRA